MIPDIVAPQLAQEANVSDVASFVTDDQWVLEQKLDGNRVMMMSPGGDYPPTFVTRNGNPYTKKVPEALKKFRFPQGTTAGGVVFDGELVRNGSNDYTYWVFDLPVLLDGVRRNLCDSVLTNRRNLLEALHLTLGGPDLPFRLVPQAKRTEDKISLAERALAENYEGLIAKRSDSPYWFGGRGPAWLKLKFTATADVVVTGVRTDGKDSVDLGIWDGHAGFLPVGRASLIGKEKNGRINKDDVLEVRYLYVGAGGRLYQPTIIRRRYDKRPVECRGEDFKHVNKAVLEAL